MFLRVWAVRRSPFTAVSYTHLQGDIDFERVKADGVRFVIIKAGQGLREMGTFRQKYLPAVLTAGLDWGAYWWSDAVTVAEAQKEAAVFVRVLDGLRPTYPAVSYTHLH